MDDAPDPFHILSIFQPFRLERRALVQSNGARFVHYTSADAAKAILQTKSIWLRKTTCMNDYSEVEHGLTCLAEAYAGEAGGIFKAALNNIFEGITIEIENLFNRWQDHLWGDTYIMCLSEHSDEEDDFGRLSMWRAYSKKTGIALILNNSPFYNDEVSEIFGCYSSPVAYLSVRPKTS